MSNLAIAVIFIILSLSVIKFIRRRGLTTVLAVAYTVAILCLALFRDSSVDYWYNLCPLYGITIGLEYEGSFFSALLQGGVRFACSHRAEDFFINIVVFIPCGYFLPALFQKMDRWWKIVFIGFLVSMAIESIQYLAGVGYADINDVISNTAGAAAGYTVYRLLFDRKATYNDTPE